MTVRDRFPTMRAGYERLSQWASQHVAPLVAVSLVGMAFAVGLSVSARMNTDDEARQRAAVDRARSAQIDWDQKNAAHDTCIRQSNGRAESRRTFYGIFDTLATVVSGEDLAVVDELRRGVAENLPNLNCDKLAPAPKGTRPVVVPAD